MASGRFEEAAERAWELENLVHVHSTLHWPRPEVAANNGVLARFFAGGIGVSVAAQLLEPLAQAASVAGDNLLLRNNRGVLVALSGDLNQAKSLITGAYQDHLSTGAPDCYHRYFLCSNLAVLEALAGNLDLAGDLFADCHPAIQDLFSALKPTIMKRHELLVDMLNEAPGLSPGEWDNRLLELHGMQVGPQWAFYGRGFLLTDIQFWSAD